MTAKACVYFESITRDQEVIVGDSKRLVLQIQNCGDADGNFYSEIKKDGVRCASEHNKSISVGRLGSLLECALFDMPNRVVTVDYCGGRAEGGVWKEDFHHTYKLTPKVVTEKCTQWFKVKDNLGNAIAGARIKIENDKTEYKNTASNGRISFELTVGVRYTATASKSGYECLRCTNNFEAPYGGEITLTLTKEVEYCSQNVRVVTSDGASVSAHIVWGDGASEYGTTPKTFTHRYEEGKSRTVTVTASGYTRASKTFTTCRSQFTLTLTKEVAPPDVGRINVSSTPSGAKIWVKPAGSTSYYYTGYSTTQTIGGLPVGVCGVKVTKEGYKDAIKTVTIYKDKTTDVSFTLEEEVAPACDTYTTKSSCEAAGCYWWSDGTCHDTKEVAPPPTYKECGRSPIESDSKTYVTDWWKCAYGVAVKRGICVTNWYDWNRKAREDIKKELGASPHILQQSNSRDGDYVKIGMGAAPEIYLGRFKWVCAGVGHGMFGITEVVEDHLPDWIIGYVCATCPGAIDTSKYDYKCPVPGYKVTRCSTIMDPLGGHGCCATCHVSQVTLERIEKEETVICDFDIYDAADKKVTDLVAGIGYWIKAYLCKVEGGGCAEILKGCDSGCEISGETLKLFLFGAAEIASGTTNVDGYTAFFWTPSADLVPKVGIRLEFTGSAKYNASETETKTVTVSADRFEVTVTEGVPTHGCCLTVSRKDFKIPFTETCVLGKVKAGLNKVAKKVGDTVIFDTRDGLEVGKKYVINVGYEPPYPFDDPGFCGGYHITAKTDEFVEFGGVKKINVKGFYEAPSWQKWWCGVFDVAEVDCNSAWALAPLHILYAPRSWSLVMRGTELDGTTPGTPTKWDKAFVSLDCLVFLPVSRFKNIGGMGANLAKAVAKDARVLTWLDKTHSDDIAKAVTHASSDEYKVFIKLLEDGKFVDADTWVRWWADKIPTTKEVTQFTKWIDNLIVQSKKAIDPEDVLSKLDDAWKVIDSQADDIVKGSAKVLKEAKTEDEALKAIRGIIDSGMWDDLPRWFKKMKITKVYKPPIAGSEKFIEGGFSISDIGRFRVVTKAGSAEKLFKAGELLDEAKYCVGGEDALFRKFSEKFAFLAKHFTDDELKLAKKEVLAAANLFKGEEAKLVRAYGYSIEAFMDTKVATKGLDAFVRATVKGLGEVKGIGTVGDEGLETLIRILGEGARKGAKNLPVGEAEAWGRIIKLLENMPARSAKLMGKELDKAAKAMFKMPFRNLSRWMKVSIIFSMLALGSTAFGVFTSFCLQLFMGEETIQWAGFGGIPLNNLLRDWDKKTPAEKTKIATIFRKFHTDRDTLHTNVEKAMSIFLILCFPFATIYRLFLEADTINLAALDTSITYLEEGLESKDRGQCTIKVRANVDTVDIFLGGIPFTAGEPEPILVTAGRIKQTARALSFTEVENIPVFNKSYTLTVYGWKAGYLVAVQKYVIESNYTGYGIDWDLPKLEVPTLELTPETGLLGRKGRTFENPFPYGMSGEVLGQVETKSQPWGLTPWNEYYGYGIEKKGKIRCETSPTGMTIWIKGGEWVNWTEYEFPTNATIPSVLTGDYQIKFTDPKGIYKDCLANDGKVITVRGVEAPSEAKCHMEPIVSPKPTAKFTFTPPKPTVNQTITFDATDSIPNDTTIISYDWDWGEVGKPHGTKKIETHAYIAKGTYRVVLTVENDKGGTDSFYQDVYVEIPTGNIKCYCTPAEYCKRNADIYVDDKKVDVTKESGYTYIKNVAPGTHTVKCNLLDVMECSGSVTVTADTDVDFKCQLKSKLLASQTAKVTAIVDGDSIRTNITDALPAPPGRTHQEVRIVGYDAYECRVYPSDCTTFGKYAYDELKKHIPIGTSITLKIDGWLPLGTHNRVIAGVFVGTKDIVAEMLKSCLVPITEKKYRDKLYWITWADYERIWCDPKEAVASAEHKPTIIDIDLRMKSFKIKNNWLTLWLLAEFVDSGGSVIGRHIPERQVEGGRASAAIKYFAGTYAIKLYARVDKKEDWTLVDTRYVAVPTKTVTFNSIPVNAAVTVVKVGSAGALTETSKLVRALKRVKSM